MPVEESRRSGPNATRNHGSRARKFVLLALAALFAFAGTALAIGGGLQNISFEDGLNGWEASVFRGASYSSESSCDDKDQKVVRDSICVIDGPDNFTAYTYGNEGDPWAVQSPITVTPHDGSKMVRLGGPFNSSKQSQSLHRYLLKQTFTVPSVDPVVKFTYNVFTFDYSGYDELRMRVRVLDDDGQVVAQQIQGAFGSGIDLKTTGWRGFSADLTGFEGQQLRLVIDSGGTADSLFGFWAYIDGGDAPAPLPAPTATVPPQPGGGATSLWSGADEAGNTEFQVPISQVSNLGGVLPLTLTFKIPVAAGAVVSNVKLRWSPRFSSSCGSSKTVDATGPVAGSYSATIDVSCSGDLSLIYTVTEGAEVENFIVPYGGITLIDPQGIVHDKVGYDASVAAGLSPDAARAANAISGAKVRLQRLTDGTWSNVLASDPGISPHINPQTTGGDGKFQWDVSGGTYRVQVTAPGYVPFTSEDYLIPPPKLDAHIGLSRTVAPLPPPSGGNSGQPADPCSGKTGKMLSKCKLDQKIKSTCTKGNKAVKSACANRLRALEKCKSVKKAKKRKACKSKAEKAYKKAVAKAKKK